MIKIGHSAAPFRETVKEIDDIADIKLDFVEISLEPPYGSTPLLEKNAEKIAKRLEKKKLFALAHAPHWIDLGSLELVTRAAWISEVKKMIDVSDKIGIHGIVVHPNAPELIVMNEEGRKQMFQNFAESFTFLLDYGKKRGVKVYVENVTEKIKDFEKILNSAEGLAMCFDAGHAFLQGGFNNIKNFVDTFGDKIEHVQLSDNNGKADQHEPLGAGKVPWEKVIPLLKKINYDRTVTLEIFGHTRSVVKKSADYLRRLWGE